MSLLSLRRSRAPRPTDADEEPDAGQSGDTLYAVGDIHGQHTMLQSLLEKLFGRPLRDEDTLVFLGDYIDRGPDSKGVIETLLQLRENHHNTLFLRGNHEQLLLDAAQAPPPQTSDDGEYLLFDDAVLLWLQNGGVETLESYGVEDYSRWQDGIPESHWQFFRDTAMEASQGRYHLVHAGLLPDGALWDDHDGQLDPRLWIREPFLSSRSDFGGQVVVFGHTPQQSGRPLVQRNKIGLDTGAVFGGPLTAAILHPHSARPQSPRFLHVPHVSPQL